MGSSQSLNGAEHGVLVTAEVAGSVLSVNPETLRRWAREGRVPSYRTGRTLKFVVSELLDTFRTPTTTTTRQRSRIAPDFDAIDKPRKRTTRTRNTTPAEASAVSVTHSTATTRKSRGRA